ncbi:PLP-dependent transferase [Lacihabitans sp. LS3-19]|uniref:trans-sulfuration enzyme family protein n=1 Tax=Lacihabitans sp. LS3-19 TaxID=2487335 RepID=UPI0020CBA53B|nr:PLP-dependent aspartate aminotransferase family protein [Lacihabitans sp. LS3-19]MCP9769026.1 PLP-dependent transferase [Lacihabitans sp. LS3-19]
MQSIETTIIHKGISNQDSGAVVSPLIQSTTFLRDENGSFVKERDIYSRASNPNRRLLEEKLAILENGTEALCFSSGQAASIALFHTIGSSSHIIIPDDIYYGTRLIIEKLYANWNITFSIVDMSNLRNIEEAITLDTKLIWIETPSNPKLKIADLQEISILAKSKNILTACDNTWATPYFTQPLEFGIDIVMHSTTKYLGGHSDILGGALIFGKNLDENLTLALKDYQSIGGGVPSPNDCWLLNRSLSTFFLRMQRHAENAKKLAFFFQNHDKIEKVYYPGLKEHENHEIAKKQMKNGFGGMISIEIKGDEDNCLRVASKLRVFKHATSLGGVESLVDHRRTAEGIHSVSPVNLLRVSVGIEDIDDLLEDFSQALS